MTPRLAQQSDRAALDALYEDTRRAEFEMFPPALAAQVLAQQVRGRRAGLEGLIGRREWLIERDGLAAAHLVLAELDSELRLVDVRVAPAWRGQRLGRALLELALGVADAEGRALALRVEHGNFARAWYLRQGFLPTGEASEIDESLRRPARP